MSIRRFARVLLIAVFAWLSGSCFAQIDTTINLTEIFIQSEKPTPVTVGERIEHWNDSTLSKYDSRSLADLLSWETGAFVKSYGSGGIATISLRGSSAGQTTISWNGVPIQNPMLGLQDLSLIPIGFVDEAQISYGGNSALEGSGSIAGVVSLKTNNVTQYGWGASLKTSLGSFGLWDQQVQFKYGNGKIGGVTRYFHQQSTNDFKYRINPDLPETSQTHAAIKQDGVLQEFHYNIQSNQHLSALVWWQKSEREIPPTTVQNKSEATQGDESFRMMLNWKLNNKVWKWKAKTALFQDRISYRDPQIRLEANSKSTVIMGEMRGSWSIDPAYELSLGANHYFYSAITDSYAERHNQQRTALFASYLQHFGKWSGQLNIRQELVDGKFTPFVLAFGVEGALNNYLIVKGKVSRDYRLPTLNDLYWVPGGNPNLESEKSWSQEVGLSIHPELGHQNLIYSITAFNRNVKNWILWSIVPGESYWAPQNLAEVHSRGIEQRLIYQATIGAWTLNTRLGYDFILSTNEVAIQTPMIEAGEQLVYVPEHSGFASLSLGWKNISISYRHTFTGEVSTGNNAQLNSYSIGNAQLQYKWVRTTFSISPFIEIDNIWDASYRVLQYRPMPGRNFRVGLTLDFG